MSPDTRTDEEIRRASYNRELAKDTEMLAGVLGTDSRPKKAAPPGLLEHPPAVDYQRSSK